jgi:RimJ/RimL family protein N-acetyltransferase
MTFVYICAAQPCSVIPCSRGTGFRPVLTSRLCSDGYCIFVATYYITKFTKAQTMQHWDLSATLVLENDRVLLEPLEERHFNQLIPIALNNEGLMRYSPQSIASEEELSTYIETARYARSKGKRYAFAIFDKAKKAYAGSTSYGNIEPFDSRLEIGWTWIGREYQGTGLNKEMKFLMLENAFERLEVMRLELRTHHENLRSQGAIRSIGATLDGTLRSHTLMRDGSRRNTMVFSILREEWPEIRQAIFAR